MRPAVLDLAAYFLRARIFRQHLPLLASFKLTYRCNLACQACPYHLRAGEDRAHMSWERACQSLEHLQRKGCRIVVFEGGEPLLWRDGGHDFNALAALARRLFLRTAATTNGTLALDVPTDVLWVSMDGDRATHDALRSGSFGRIMDNLKASPHPRLLIHYTINSLNIDDMDPLALTVAALPQVKGLTFQLFYPYHRGEADLSLSPAQRRRAMEEALRLKREGLPVLNSRRVLTSMIANTWRCHAWALANVDPDGTISQGCYVDTRGTIDCSMCGFTPVAEASEALDLHPASILAGWRIFIR